MKKIASKNEFDFASIGAGPAGMAAVLYAARSGLKSLALDFNSGGQALSIASLENYPGVFPSVNGFDFINSMRSQAENFGAIFFHANVRALDKIGSTFFLETDKEKFAAKSVLIATGAEHKKLGVPGEKEFSGKGVSYCATCDGAIFRDKNVFVIGGGDAACDEAVYLSAIARHVTIVHRRDEFRAQKTLEQRVLQNKKISVIFDSVVKEILGEEKVKSILLENVKTAARTNFECDAVFISIGMKPRTEIFSTLQKDSGGYIITDENMRTKIPRLYAAGDVRAKTLRQIVTAASDGAIAAFCAANDLHENRS